jgi:NADPH:quinone reductase-like Zn-dependent oxidoreductase/NADP-dependent 3-hydroxy acid dehydrogenase YdfG/acyl carrier protein
MLAAAAKSLGDGPIELNGITFEEALIMNPEQMHVLETSINERGVVKISSRIRGQDNGWISRATGQARRWHVATPPAQERGDEVKHSSYWMAGKILYETLRREGHDYGELFRGASKLIPGVPRVIGEIELPTPLSCDGYLLHPVILDSCFHLLRGLKDIEVDNKDDESIIFPIRIERMRWLKPLPDKVHCVLNLLTDTELDITSDLLITDSNRHACVEIEGFRCRRLRPASIEEVVTEGKLYAEEWERLPPREVIDADENPHRHVLIVAETGSWGRKIADELGSRASRISVAYCAESTGFKDGHFEVAASRMGFSKLFELVDANFTDVVFATGGAPEPGAGAERIEDACLTNVDGAIALLQALSISDRKPRLHIVTVRAITLAGDLDLTAIAVAQSALIGISRTATTEMPDIRPRIIDVDQSDTSLQMLADELIHPDEETEVAIRQRSRFAPRLVHKRYEDIPRRRRSWNPSVRLPAFKVGMQMPGILERIACREMEIPTIDANQVLVEVHYASLNFRDIMAATNLLPPEAEVLPAWEHLGLECSGIIRAVGTNVDSIRIGESVSVIAPDSLASHVVVPSAAAFALPPGVDLKQAAAIPVAFATAHHSLVTLARLARDEDVLIHAAAGGVGLAAVNIARSIGARIVATAGSEDKRAYLRQQGVEHVFDSRSLAFVDQIKALTDGRGVDVVLNSLPSGSLQGSLSLLAPGGRFIEIGKRDVYADSSIGLRQLRDNASLFVVDLARLASDRPAVLASELKSSLNDIENGVVSPIPIIDFGVGAAKDAFRYMSRASHIGKVVLAFDDASANIELRERSSIVDEAATYIVTGGTRGFGLTIAAELVEDGARSLVLVGRTKNLSTESQSKIEMLRKRGAKIIVVSADIGTRNGVNKALQAARLTTMPLRGIVHAAGVVHSTLIRDLDKDSIADVFAAKVLGAWYLHEASFDLSLDFFICCSSISAILGPLGQAHYAAANRALDTIALIRRAHGLNALSINFGPIADAGFLVEQPELAKFLDQSGISSTTAADCYRTMKKMLVCDPGAIAFAALDGSRLAIALPGTQSPRTASLLSRTKSDHANFGKIRQQLIACSEAKRPAVLASYFQNLIGAVLKIEPKAIALDQPLSDIGLDSLTLFEMKNRVELEMGISIPVGRLLQRPAIDQMVPDILCQLNAQLRRDLDEDAQSESLEVPEEVVVRRVGIN